jgi:hypothetical protein
MRCYFGTTDCVRMSGWCRSSGRAANGDGARLAHSGVYRVVKTVVWAGIMPVTPISSPSPLSSPVEGEEVENVDAELC